ncbi:MAG TPA: VIT domain-containing protein [Kofleriaceae bacterium]
MSDDELVRFGRDPEAGFGALTTPSGALPLVALDVDARIDGVIVAIDIAQRFVNRLREPVEATYIFPLPDRAAVHRFRMEVGGRVIEGELDERGAARAQYDAAIAAGQRAAIAEEDRPGVFTMRVGNLMPGDVATVRLSLVGPLPVDDGEATFRFPLVVAPRYIPGVALGGDQAGLGTAGDTDLVPDASRITPPVLLPGMPNPVQLGIRVAFASEARELASSLHAVTERRRDAFVVELNAGERLDRDFVLRWRVDADALKSSLVVAADPGAQTGTFLLTLVPPSTTAMAARPRDLVFVIDRSGSMGGWKMVAARRAVARMIDTLTSRDRFAVLAFDNVIEAVPETGLRDATDRGRFNAVEAIAKIEARGGTEMQQPLSHAAALLAGGTQDRERAIVLVTDGQVGNEDYLLHVVTPHLKNIKLFALGIDQAVNAAFLRRLAGAGGGLCELVESEDRLDAVMAKVHRRLGTPIATELALRFAGLELEAATIAPAKLPDVYAGAPVVVMGRYRGAPAGAIELVGTTFGEPLRERVVAVSAPPSAQHAIAASWARAHIRDLEDMYAAGRTDVHDPIVRISTRFGVLSRFTAFVAVDRSEVVNRGGAVRQIVQAVEDPFAAGKAEASRQRAFAAAAGMPRGANTRTQSGVLSSYMPPTAAPMMPQMQQMPQPASPPSAASPAPAPASASASASAPAPKAEKAKVSSIRRIGAAERSDDRDELALAAPEPVPPLDPYLATLRDLARDLASQTSGNVAALRLLRQRLLEWLEDLKSVFPRLPPIWAIVDALVRRLTAALAIVDSAEVTAIAAALSAAASQRPASRAEFWK